MSRRDISQHISKLGPSLVQRALIRASLGDWDATKALLPYVVPRANRYADPISDKVQIDISSPSAAKETLHRIAAAIGDQIVGLEEGTAMMDAVGKALDRISSADLDELAARLDALESAPANTATGGGVATVPQSRANGSTPQWGNIIQHPSVKTADET